VKAPFCPTCNDGKCCNLHHHKEPPKAVSLDDCCLVK